MTKIRLVIIATLCFLSMTWLACEKGDVSGSKDIGRLQQTMAEPLNLQVSNFGFLVFTSVADFNQFSDFLEATTFGEIKNYFHVIGFNSLGVEEYGDYNLDNLITSEMISDMALSESGGVLQIQNTIFKPAIEDGYVLTLNVVNLTPNNFQNLTALSFDPENMNRYIADGAIANLDDGLNTLNEHPTGINEIPHENIPVSTMGKFWKNKVTKDPCNEKTHQRLVTMQRFRFWVRWGDAEYHFEPC